MSTFKIILTLLISLSSLLASSQTFVLNGADYIGKTKKEIKKINEVNNSKFFTKEKTGPITSILYVDSLNSMMHHFLFTRRGPFGIGPYRCISYLVNVGDRPQYEKIKADLNLKCKEKISDRRLLQISGTKKYDWLLLADSDASQLYTFAIEKHHDKRNNR